jgi:hypothetical protein
VMMLAEIDGWFTAGFELKEAQAFLEQLGA